MKKLMDQYQPQQTNQRLLTFWQSCVLCLLLGSLAFVNWDAPRQISDPTNSALIVEFEQLTLANYHRDYFRSERKSADGGGNGGDDADHYAYISLLQVTVSTLFNTVADHSLPVLAANSLKYTLPLNRAPPCL